MATYLKRSTKLFERLAAINNSNCANNSSTSNTRNNNRQSTEPSLSDVICPVCRMILREPVTLPCAHNLCLRCLRGTIEHNSLTCPLCRQRVGSWLRNATKTESLVNVELWQLIRRRFPEELELVARRGSSNNADDTDFDFHSEFTTKKILSAAGEIRREYEVQLQMAEEEMWRQREKERLASEAFIRKIQEEEEQQKLVQLAQDQLLAKTLAKQEVFENSNKKNEFSNKSKVLVNSLKSKSNFNQLKFTTNVKMSVKSKETIDARKKNMVLISKRSERHASNVKTSSMNICKESSPEIFSTQKPVSIHNAVTRIVTHQNRISEPNNTTHSSTLRDFIASTSKLYGLQSKEELHVPNDILSNKKKKLGVEVCVGVIEGKERIGSAESAGSHDSINQEIHHFKPIKALPRTPLRITLDGRQVDPKLIRVLPVLKRVSNAMPKPPTPTHLKKIFGCSWSAFKRISRRQQIIFKEHSDKHSVYQPDKKLEQSLNVKLNKSLQELDMFTAEQRFDKNKNYTKNVNKIIIGNKLNIKDNLGNKQGNVSNSIKQHKPVEKLKNGLLLNKNKHYKETNIEKKIEIVDIEDDKNNLEHLCFADSLGFTHKIEVKPSSPVLELVMENIAERIKRRKMTKMGNENIQHAQSAFNLIAAGEELTKAKSKKISLKGRKQKIKKMSAAIVIKSNTKTKMRTLRTMTSQIKRLTARSMKRPRYTEELKKQEEQKKENEKEKDCEYKRQEQRKLGVNMETELNRSNADFSFYAHPKNSRKSVKRKKKKKVSSVVKTMKITTISETSVNFNDDEDEAIIREQQRLERLASQEREDRELALRLQARFNAMERIAGRTRRGAARVPSLLLNEPID